MERFRTVWISDTHLGTKGCQADVLSSFLKVIRCDKLYLVGDIVDMWRLKSKWYWPLEHNNVVRRILKKASKGTEVIFIPGNHDDGARQFLNYNFGGIVIKPYCSHFTADGRKLFVTHGDQFDLVVTNMKLLSSFGSFAYEILIDINRIYNQVRRYLGYPYVSLSQSLKLSVKTACKYISKYEELLMKFAAKGNFDGVVCGHIHKAEINLDGTIAYYNSGDWVESCTALVEHYDGTIELIDATKWLESRSSFVEARDFELDFEYDRQQELEFEELGFDKLMSRS